MRKKILIIDTFNFLHRAYHALPLTFRDSKGEPVNAVYGVTSMLINLFGLIKPNYIAAALDSEEPTFRLGNFTAYKAHRAPTDPGLISQIPKIIEILEAFGIPAITVAGYEADDIIGTIAKKYGGGEYEVIIVSNDHDMWQLVNKNVTIMVPIRNASEAKWIGVNEVEAGMGFLPDKMTDYKGLRGDPSDNIPGVFGIGEKTAVKLIKEFGSIENIYKNISKVKPDSLKEKLADCAEQAVMSKNLSTIITDVPLKLELEECLYKPFNIYKVVAVLERYNFKSLIKRLGFDSISSNKKEKVDDSQLPLL